MQQKQTIAYLFSALLCLCYAAKPQPNAWNAILCHANIFHLLVNIIAVWSLFTASLNNFSPWKIIPACYLIGTLAFLISPVQAVGASAFVYAFYGFLWARFTNRTNTIVMLLFCLVSFLPSLAATVHVFSLFTAFAVYKAYCAIRFVWNHV